ncbi:response regulator transcription factor [Alicyclobacillus sp. SO9]|uniref:response regulator transcription factor n=1 Tax=Alicyclobacillus sp. SO9 TaxID=2665646 RepID=UPI0018E8B9A3|nr:response regulator transcription factor [Alicyclobacillus sp. SO9]QQE79472.1 response regulator transcription factor [Alicyclobacillus sp. SO9]
MINVVIADDQSMIRTALSALLGMEEDIEIKGEAANGLEALELCLQVRPDVAVLDIEMPGKSGLEVAERLREKLPSCAVLMVTTFARPGYLQKAMKAGAKGYLLKEKDVEELVSAIRTVANGGTVVDNELLMTAFSAENPLTSRETELLAAARAGGTTRELAGKLHLSEGTVRNYVSEIIAKLEVQNRQEAVRKAEESGWI